MPVVVRVLIVGDDVRGLERETDVQVVAHVESAADAAAVIDLRHPDVTVVALGVSAEHTLQAIERIRNERPSTSVLVVVDDDVPATELLAAVRLGATAVVPAPTGGTPIVDVVRRAARGQLVLPDDVLAQVVRSVDVARHSERTSSATAGNDLSPREREILSLLARGTSRADVAAQLGVSVNTVRSHLKRVMQKLGVHSLRDAAEAARRAGVIESPH